MAYIHSLSIKNYRGIKSIGHVFGDSKFICLIGRGDAGKSSILEAIANVLSPNWNLSFHDNDFYNCETENPIEIEVTLADLPNSIINESKYGLYIRGIDTETGFIYDDIETGYIKCLTIQLKVKKDLEPSWCVVNSRITEPVPFSANDRAKLNVFAVSDYVDRHFSWSRGNPLYYLLKKEGHLEGEDDNIIIEALRDAKNKIDGCAFKQFDGVISKVKTSAAQFGVKIENASTTIDFRDISIKDSRVCLHDENIPFRLKGKGSKRLLSIAIQIAVADAGGIVLIDEIEQGLEPDRVQHLVSSLKRKNKGQVFITTHNRDAVVELDCLDLLLFNKSKNKFINFDSELQGCLRTNPEVFFAKKVIVCEGPTEIGMCRALNTYRTKNKPEANLAYIGVRLANGVGGNCIKYSDKFNAVYFPTCLFCDSDVKEMNKKKNGLIKKGIKVIDWDEEDCIEVAICKDVSLECLKEVLHLASDLLMESKAIESNEAIQRIWNGVKDKFGKNCPDRLTSEVDSPRLRRAIGLAANSGEWFKNQTKGEKLGDIIFLHFDSLPDNKLKSQLTELSNWIDQDGL
jgi:putative ATP-dependent endonuclease of the OLD family